MSTETMINSMGGSIKENVKRGPKGPQRNPLKQALLPSCFGQLVSVNLASTVAGPLGPA